MAHHRRDALLHSDGSLSVFPPGTSREQIRREREDIDSGLPPKDRTLLVSVWLDQVEILSDTAA